MVEQVTVCLRLKSHASGSNFAQAVVRATVRIRGTSLFFPNDSGDSTRATPSDHVDHFLLHLKALVALFTIRTTGKWR